MMWAGVCAVLAGWVTWEFRHSHARGSGWVAFGVLAVFTCWMLSSFLSERETMWMRWRQEWTVQWEAERAKLDAVAEAYKAQLTVKVAEYERELRARLEKPMDGKAK